MGFFDKFKSVFGLGDKKKEQSKPKKRVKKALIPKPIIKEISTKDIIEEPVITDSPSSNRKNHRRAILLNKVK